MVASAENSEGEIPPGTVVLGRYQILGKLAQGGMAEVYLARQVGPGGYQKLVVTKRVRPHLSKDEDFVGMFVNEARLAAMINHPNVVQIFDLGEEPSEDASGPGTDWFLAMEYLDGRDMLQVGRACRSHNKAVPFDVTARIIADACAGLEHAHNLKGQDGKILDLVHRDMSPENIIITFEGQVKVVDFGIAKAADNSIRTQAGQIKGKLGYVAPEAILGKPVDARADIFAVGATLYLFLSGRPAFTGNSPMEIFERSLKTPPSPQEVNPRVPPALDEICMKALHQDRDKRYRTAGDVRAALDAYLQSTGRPLGAPQLSQFMRILFPPDKDPVRQRIDGLLADAQLFVPPAKKPVARSVSTPQLPVAAPAPLDHERTAVVAPRAVEIGPAIDSLAPPLGVSEARPGGPSAGKAAPATQPARVGPSHLRSVGVSDDIPDVSNPNATMSRESVDDGKTQLTGGRAHAPAVSGPVRTTENVDVVRTMDIEGLPSEVQRAFEEPTYGGVDVSMVDEEDEMRAAAAALSEDDLDDMLSGDAPTALTNALAQTSLPPPPPSDPGASATALSHAQRSFTASRLPETGVGMEIAPPPFEESSPGMPPPPPSLEEPLFQPPSPELAREDLLVEVTHVEAPRRGDAVPLVMRLAMAFLGALTGSLLLLIVLAVAGKLSLIFGN